MNNNKVVIGITGVKTAGKNTVCDMFKKYIPNVEEVALAKKLKDVCAEVFDKPRDSFDCQVLKEKNFDSPITLNERHISEILVKFGHNTTISKTKEDFKEILSMELDSPRRIAQIVGTEILRSLGNPDIHCEKMEMSDKGVSIITDIRFENEFEFFSKRYLNFIPIYVQ